MGENQIIDSMTKIYIENINKEFKACNLNQSTDDNHSISSHEDSEMYIFEQ